MPFPTSSVAAPIVVGVDGGPRSVAALRWAVDLGRTTGNPVRAVFVHTPSTVAIAGFDGVAVMPAELDVDGAELLERAVGLALGDPRERASIDRAVRYGNVVDVLLDESRAAAALVVGQRISLFGQRFLGAARRLVAQAPCPVVVVPPAGAERSPEPVECMAGLVARAG
jgi:nucleotide-binding universal stress UspA family protein